MRGWVRGRLGARSLRGSTIGTCHLGSNPCPTLLPALPGLRVKRSYLEVVDEQDNAMAASRLAEYFIDMGHRPVAANVGQALRKFPADLGVLLAQAQLAIALNDSDEFARTVEVLVRRISGGSDKALPWDREFQSCGRACPGAPCGPREGAVEAVLGQK